MSLPLSSRLRRRAAVAAATAASLVIASTALAGGEVPAKPKPPPTPPPPKGVVDVGIAKTSDAETYAPGAVVTYTITITNTGDLPVALGRIVVSDPSLPNLAPTGSLDGQLGPGQSATWTGTRAVTVADCGATIVNTATVSLLPAKTGGADTNPGNDSATRSVVVGGGACTPVTSPPLQVIPATAGTTTPPGAAKPRPSVCPRPALTAVLSGPGSPAAGGSAVYRVTVRSAKARADKVHLRVRIPRGFYLPGSVKPSRLRGGDLVMGIGRLRAGGARTVGFRLMLDSSATAPGTLKVDVTARCGGTTAATQVLSPVAVIPARVQPAVTG